LPRTAPRSCRCRRSRGQCRRPRRQPSRLLRPTREGVCAVKEAASYGGVLLARILLTARPSNLTGGREAVGVRVPSRTVGYGRAAGAGPVLREAFGLWRGAPYQGGRGAGVGAADGARLDELGRAATEELSDWRLGGEDPGGLVPELEAMVGEEPLRERRWGQL